MNEDFEWVKRCILSCTNEFQLGCVSGMIELFYAKHPSSGMYSSLVESMEQRRFIMDGAKLFL